MTFSVRHNGILVRVVVTCGMAAAAAQSFAQDAPEPMTNSSSETETNKSASVSRGNLGTNKQTMQALDQLPNIDPDAFQLELLQPNVSTICWQHAWDNALDGVFKIWPIIEFWDAAEILEADH